LIWNKTPALQQTQSGVSTYEEDSRICVFVGPRSRLRRAANKQGYDAR
jgi:hypothetical protein